MRARSAPLRVADEASCRVLCAKHAQARPCIGFGGRVFGFGGSSVYGLDRSVDDGGVYLLDRSVGGSSVGRELPTADEGEKQDRDNGAHVFIDGRARRSVQQSFNIQPASKDVPG